MTNEETIKALLHKNLQLQQQKKRLVREHAMRMRSMRQALLDQYILRLRLVKQRIG